MYMQDTLFHKYIREHHTHQRLISGCKVLYLIGFCWCLQLFCADCGDLITMTGRESGICGCMHGIALATLIMCLCRHSQGYRVSSVEYGPVGISPRHRRSSPKKSMFREECQKDSPSPCEPANVRYSPGTDSVSNTGH